ncbi:hypothetical protein PIB30_000456 [Stylosanthes scabra]|uniref:Uncharacterized protein n=1 Tax=Stylosanthes scabra TaxID=79078 RepID=A0ABU6V0U0_9FABA|nr:hypothetical protein [Stylosanthes scabra]
MPISSFEQKKFPPFAAPPFRNLHPPHLPFETSVRRTSKSSIASHPFANLCHTSFLNTRSSCVAFVARVSNSHRKSSHLRLVVVTRRFCCPACRRRLLFSFWFHCSPSPLSLLTTASSGRAALIVKFFAMSPSSAAAPSVFSSIVVCNSAWFLCSVVM